MTRSLPALGRAAALGSVLCALAANVAAAFQVTPYGSGVNPPGSLVVTSGIPMVGENFTVGVSNTASTSAPAALAFLSLATAPDPAFPAGTVLPGFGVVSPGAPGELLLSLAPPNPFATSGPVVWNGGAAAPASFEVAVPLVLSLSGISIYLQGTLVDLAAGPSLGVTNGLQVPLTAPSFPGLVPIPPGTFQMGSDAANAHPYFSPNNEKPAHQVTITKPFWMGRYEVTQTEFQALVGFNPSFHVGPDRPVEHVARYQAKAYCQLLNAEQTALGKVPAGYQYRLPTEAEWEYACRAGSTTEFSFGPDLFCDQAAFSYSFHSNSECSGWQSGTKSVGSYAPNAWGLYDMHGNVWEWCLDLPKAYSASPKTDPFGGSAELGVFRGGSWDFGSQLTRSAYRLKIGSTYISGSLGFRVVLGPVLIP